HSIAVLVVVAPACASILLVVPSPLAGLVFGPWLLHPRGRRGEGKRRRSACGVMEGANRTHDVACESCQDGKVVVSADLSRTYARQRPVPLHCRCRGRGRDGLASVVVQE